MKIFLITLFIINASVGMEQNIKLPSFAELLASLSNPEQFDSGKSTESRPPISAHPAPNAPQGRKRSARRKRKAPPSQHPNQFNFSQQPAHIPLMFLSDHPKAKNPNKNN